MAEAIGRSVRILMISDIHICPTFESQFKQLMEEEKNIDMIFNCGDVAMCVGSDSNRKNKRDEDYDKFKSIMSIIDTYHIPQYFVPGNHDLLEHFSEGNEHQLNYINMHNRVEEILPGLCLVGYGGSCISSCEGIEHLWSGYPKDTSDFPYKEIHSLFDSVPEDKQMFVLTHCPPSIFGTSSAIKKRSDIVATDDDPESYVHVNGGSQLLYDIIFSASIAPRFVGLVHGHMHAAQGLNSIGAMDYSPAVINAGPFNKGRYTILNLINKNNKWMIKEISCKRL
ncbi:hypothetical protein WA158_004268 [Blastocystis sp. Blastoise]